MLNLSTANKHFLIINLFYISLSCFTKNVNSSRRTIGYKNHPFYYASKQIFQPLVTIFMRPEFRPDYPYVRCPLSKTSSMTQSATELPGERESA
jgi:hypothetical protein